MSIALVVAPCQAGKLYNVAADQTGIAEPDPTLGVDPQARVVVVVQGTAERDLPAAPHSWPRQPLGQVQDVHGLFCGVYGRRVGNTAISPGAEGFRRWYSHAQQV